MFLRDHYSGKKSYLKKGPDDPNGIFLQSEIDSILSRTGDNAWQGLVNPDTISFPYGPDAIRDQDGRWTVLEDNLGWVGGVGDLKRAREILLKLIPQYKDKLALLDSPENFYRDLIDSYRKQMKNPKEKIVVFSIPPMPDNEDSRVRKLFTEQGVEAVTPFTKKKLVVEKDGAYLVEKLPNGKTKREKVGYVILNGEHKDLDWSHPLTREMAYRWNAEAILAEKKLSQRGRKALEEALKPNPSTGRLDLEKVRAAIKLSGWYDYILHDAWKRPKGLLQAILDGRVATNYSPGVDFVGDKEFYMKVPQIIEFYLHEKPILQNGSAVPFFTHDATGQRVPNEEAFETFAEHPERYVAKPFDGRGGDGIFVGPKLSRAELKTARQTIRNNFGNYELQQFIPLSVLGDLIVDTRPISAVFPGGKVFVPETLWGRGISIHSNGKVNISGEGVETAVGIVPDPSLCSKGLQKAGN